MHYNNVQFSFDYTYTEHVYVFMLYLRYWNSLTDTFLSAAEGAEDSVAKFTSLVRARD